MQLPEAKICVVVVAKGSEKIVTCPALDFGGLQMIFVNRIGVPDVPLEVYSFFNLRFHIVIFKYYSWLSFY